MDKTYRDAVSVSVWLGLANDDGFDWPESMVDLANRPYWSRYWVIQEFLLGQRVELFFSDHRIDWADFQVQLCNETGIEPLSTDYKSDDSYRALPLVMGRHPDKHPEVLQPLYDLLVDHHQSRCKDPRDRVFALLGLISPEERRPLSRFFPDYTLKDDHVLIITLAHLMEISPLIAPQVDYGHITPDSEKLFLGLGVESKARRRRLLRRAKTFYGYGYEGPVSGSLQELAYDDGMEEFLDLEDPAELGEVSETRSSNARTMRRIIVFLGVGLGLGVLLWQKWGAKLYHDFAIWLKLLPRLRGP